MPAVVRWLRARGLPLTDIKGFANAQACTAIICMPVNTPEIKVANVRKLGGQVRLGRLRRSSCQIAAGVASWCLQVDRACKML